MANNLIQIAVRPDFGDTWEDRETRAAMTGRINFGCKISGNECYATRTRGKHGTCCERCASDIANGTIKAVFPKYAEKIVAKLFSAPFGFFRPGKGCLLPRKWRPLECLEYRCPMLRSRALKGGIASGEYRLLRWITRGESVWG